MASALAGLRLAYLIGADDAGDGADGVFTVCPYGATKKPSKGIGVEYINLYDETHSGTFEPYLTITETAKQYGELVPDPSGDGFWKNLAGQLAVAAQRGFKYVELDNRDAFTNAVILKAFDRAVQYGMQVFCKNPGMSDQGEDSTELLNHPAVIAAIIEEGDTNAAMMQWMRQAAGKPDLLCQFVSFKDLKTGADGITWARHTAGDIGAIHAANMFVSYSADGEYTRWREIPTGLPNGQLIVPLTRQPAQPARQTNMLGLLDPEAIAAAAIAHGAPWEKVNGYRHLFYIEGINLDGGTQNDNARDEWNDVCGVVEFKTGVPQIIFTSESTTEPGTYYDVQHVIGWGGRGAALIDLGYQECWQIGIHHPGYAPHESLVQRGPCRVWRDVARNFTRGQGTIQIGDDFGINHHSTGGQDADPDTVGHWSAGCLVRPRMAAHRQLMALIKGDARHVANPQRMIGSIVMPAQWVIDAKAQLAGEPLAVTPPAPVPTPIIPSQPEQHMGWRIANSLLALREQVNAKWPNRSKENDGTIGDTSHQARTSDHNPDDEGIVRAMDITHDPVHECDSYKLAETLRQSRDKRIKYIISNHRICSATVSPWQWRPYTGSNPHTQHVHVSVVSNDQLADDQSLWAINGGVQPQPIPDPGAWPHSGRGSWYSQFSGKYQWVDTGDTPNSNALGVPDDCQGCSFYDHSTLGRWFEVRAPNGIVSIEQQTDIGPAPRTGRSIDISAAAAERFGYSPRNFPTDSIFEWRAIAPPAVVAGLSPQQQAIKYRDARSAIAVRPRPVPVPVPPTPEPIMPDPVVPITPARPPGLPPIDFNRLANDLNAISKLVSSIQANPQMRDALRALVGNVGGGIGGAVTGAAVPSSLLPMIFAGIPKLLGSAGVPLSIIGTGLLFLLQAHDVVGPATGATATATVGTTVAGLGTLGGLGVVSWISQVVSQFTGAMKPPPA